MFLVMYFFILQEAECEKSAMDVKYAANTKIEDSNRMYMLQKANFDGEVNTKVRMLCKILAVLIFSFKQ